MGQPAAPIETVMTGTVTAQLHFLPSSLAGGPVTHVDLRANADGFGNLHSADVTVMNAREHADAGLHTSGFELLRSPSSVGDFRDCDEVMGTYYDECRSTARELTGAHTTFTYDHLIREPGLQYSGGGTDGTQRKTGVERGGGYIGNVHMDYTDNTTWEKYLALHGERVPERADRVYAINFWRPLSPSADDFPLAVCDARTVREEDLKETVVYGYAAENYSWYDIGIETFSVSASERQRWYYYPGMTRDDVLVIKSFDSEGVIGRTCPHASFAHPNPQGTPRHSIELRVLCFC